MKKLKICLNQIENILLQRDCAIDTTYDYSHILILGTDEEGEKISDSVAPPQFYPISHHEIDEEERINNYKNFKLALNELNQVLLVNDCKLESTYDYSHVYVYDRYGNSASL